MAPSSDTIAVAQVIEKANRLRMAAKDDEAFELVERAIKDLGPSDDLKYLRAQLLSARGLVEESVKELQLIVQRDPRHTFALNDLGAICFQRKEFESAVDYFKQALQADSLNEIAFENLIGALLESGRVDEARSLSAFKAKRAAKLDNPPAGKGPRPELAGHMLSFIVPCYNCADTIRDSIASIFQQSLPIPFEVVCADDCSTDNTLRILREYAEKNSNLHVFTHEKNKGGAAARNTCVRNSSGDLIFCLDSDNILVPGSVGRLVEHLLKTGADAASFAELRYFKLSTANHTHSWFFEAPNNLFTLEHVITRIKTPAASGNYLYTRRSYERAGGYPEGGGAMDAWGFGFRQHATGTAIAILPDSFYWHRTSDNSYWSREERIGNNDKNAVAIAREHINLFDGQSAQQLLSPEMENSFFAMISKDVLRLRKDVKESLLPAARNTLDKLAALKLWLPGQPLRLHLGCGKQHLPGYVNVDYPQSAHAVMKVRPDYEADIMELEFPPESVDEIRLHHVFEHFNRVSALALLIRWHEWLRVGGKILIETPDLIGCARVLLSDASFQVRMGIVRHLAGDQAGSWAYHVDHWFAERFAVTLGKLGFGQITTSQSSWERPPFLANVTVEATKMNSMRRGDLLENADEILKLSLVSASEEPTWQVWRGQLRELLDGRGASVSPSAPVAMPAAVVEKAKSALRPELNTLPIEEITDFNQRSRDRWVAAKARTVPAGAIVLDVGAGTCPYRPLFAHCDYRTHDFKKYTGRKLNSAAEYGQIDYVSEIGDIPLPDGSVDVVLCTEVLEHVPEPIAALREMARLLKPGGRLLVTAPLGSGPHQLPFHFYGGYTPEWYRHFGKQFGLEILEVTPNGGLGKLLAQESARMASCIRAGDPSLHSDPAFVYHLFAEWLPRYLYQLDDKLRMDGFTVGYMVEAKKL